MNITSINQKLYKEFSGRVMATLQNGAIHVSGKLDTWDEVISACQMASKRYSKTHVVNDIEVPFEIPKIRVPQLKDDFLDKKEVDVLVIGGGITGCSILRELTKWNIKTLLIDKEADLAYHASGRNDGQVHSGFDLGRGNLKHDYVLKGNAIFDSVCKDLGVPFKRVGQYGSSPDKGSGILIFLYCIYRKYFSGIKDTHFITKKKLYELDPNLNPGFKFGMLNSNVGVVSPYELTIAYGENAIKNGAEISLNTYAYDMELKDNKIVSVKTNRGTIYPKLVINAAGVFAEDIAQMANDRFFSIHPRRGTNSILDTKAGKYVNGVTSVKLFHDKGPKNTKGGGIIHTIHDNLLVGPDAVETYEKENFETHKESLDVVFKKQEHAVSKVKKGDIITYFTGVRAPTFEEDFILEKGRMTKNILHLAGIQSPGLTAAPAFSIDMAKVAIDMLKTEINVTINESFNPVRKPIPVLKDMSNEERDKLIKENPDYGIIICRCEEISKGEIIDCLKSNLVVPTVDGIKKRVRPGMGRCQGGFCMPQVIKIISEYTGIPESEVLKGNSNSFISYGNLKGGEK